MSQIFGKDRDDECGGGIDVIIRDPDEYEKMLQRVKVKEEKAKRKKMKKAKKLIEKRKEARAKALESEKNRRSFNASMLVNGNAYDKKAKKYWFQSGWTSDRFAVEALQMYEKYESDESDEGDNGGDESLSAKSSSMSSKVCCCTIQ